MALHLGAFAHNIQIPEASNDADDQPQIKKQHVIELEGEPITEPTADGDGKDQGKADGTGFIAAREEFLEKFFSLFLQLPTLGLLTRPSCKNSQKGISHRHPEVNLFFKKKLAAQRMLATLPSCSYLIVIQRNF